MKLELNCDVCKSNVFEYSESARYCIVNNVLSCICNKCLSRFIKKSYIRFTFYIKNDKSRIKLIELNDYDLRLNDNTSVSDIAYYNSITDMDLKNKIKKKLFALFGGKRNIQNKFNVKEFDFEVEHVRFSDFKCSVCGKKLDSYLYFLKKNDQLSLVCKECSDSVCGDL